MNCIESRIAEKITEIRATADDLPCVIVIHRFMGKTSSIEYMSNRGLELLNVSLEELKALGEDYFLHYLNQHDAADYIPKMFELLERNDKDEVLTFFQQIRPSVYADWQWHLSSIKILMRDDDKNPLLLIVSAMPVNHLQHVTSKIKRLLDENDFIRKSYQNFALLTAREKVVLRLIANGKSNKEISSELFISVNTSETHRKNIKAKLKANSSFELIQYASAYDLV